MRQRDSKRQRYLFNTTSSFKLRVEEYLQYRQSYFMKLTSSTTANKANKE